jgi:antitoxin ParD1/3/4
MSQFILSPSASADLAETWDFIANDNLDAADRWLAKMHQEVRRLAEMPSLGHSRKDLTDKPVLFWPVGRYLIIYQADRRPIEIVRVLSAYRDIPRLL